MQYEIKKTTASLSMSENILMSKWPTANICGPKIQLIKVELLNEC